MWHCLALPNRHVYPLKDTVVVNIHCCMLICSLDAALLCDDRQFRNPHSSHWYPRFTTQSRLLNAHTWKQCIYKVTASASFNRPALIQFTCKQPCSCQAKSISEARAKTANLIFTSNLFKCWAVDLEPQSWKRLQRLFTLHLLYSATYVLDNGNNDLNVMSSWLNAGQVKRQKKAESLLLSFS